jgi:hypothetical protein
METSKEPFYIDGKLVGPKKADFFHFYPKNRKKKRFHSQFIDYERVLDSWCFTPSLYYIFRINNAFYACLPDVDFYGNIQVNGEYFRPVIRLKDFEHGNGCVVYGYIGVVQRSCMGIMKARFVFVKNAMNPGLYYTKALSFKTKLHLEKFKRYEIWKK